MSIVLVRGGDATFDVDLMDDMVPGWSSLKVSARDGQNLSIPPDEQVELLADDDAIAGMYKVSFALAPAAPRGWRLYLDRVSGAAETSTQAQATDGSQPQAASSGGDNAKKQYAITVERAGGAAVRLSKMTYNVPYSRLSSEVQRLLRSGARIVSVEESTTY
ncbi:MAG: phycobilisome linker polypeptide [Cyanobacteria bacterium P01_D01_bin.123]